MVTSPDAGVATFWAWVGLDRAIRHAVRSHQTALGKVPVPGKRFNTIGVYRPPILETNTGSADQNTMNLPLWTWLLSGLVAWAVSVGILYTLSVRILWSRDLHHLKVEAHRLRDEHERRRHAREHGDFEIIEDDGAEAPVAAELPPEDLRAAA
ncbi:MAG: hypothetical protein EA380_07075 [Phycisphaeraceae bacterium]|nr:MAG: hypothetical protein EA380_07075 [Phycisphaeraceae bacterium]